MLHITKTGNVHAMNVKEVMDVLRRHPNYFVGYDGGSKNLATFNFSDGTSSRTLTQSVVEFVKSPYKDLLVNFTRMLRFREAQHVYSPTKLTLSSKVVASYLTH